MAVVRGGGKEVREDRENLLGEKATSDFWILMRAWNYAQKNQFRLDACRRGRPIRRNLDTSALISNPPGTVGEFKRLVIGL